MKPLFAHDEWCIIEEGYDSSRNRIAESIMSIGNGRMGQRGNFEEQYTGNTLLGNYVAGVYYPDKTRVGWWKNGYPAYFAKVLNAPNWIGIHISVDSLPLDLAECEVRNFRRVLNMREGFLERSFIARFQNGNEVQVRSVRFCSMADDECGAIKYDITPLNFDGRITIQPYIDADVENEDSNYHEKFWEEVLQEAESRKAYIVARTKKLDFQVCTGMKYAIVQDGVKVYHEGKPASRNKFVSNIVSVVGHKGQTTTIYKYAAVLSSLNYDKSDLLNQCKQRVQHVANKGFEQMLSEQAAAWAAIWAKADIRIEGDVAAQQGIRFNIFQLNQTYSGADERLNIGPKGFTGEKYGGSTYWDTEAYCVPFYLATKEATVVRNLLLYRYKQLDKAIENAAKLGFTKGAALYPMVTMNGEECHNEWEITFEEIHRNGAIAYAIYDYVNYTDDQQYLADYGLEVLIAITRFWAQRVNWSTQRSQYVLLGVTGPNEYENNVNNNWYTSTIACWCMRYTQQVVEYVKKQEPQKYQALSSKIHFDEAAETQKWQHITENMYFPADDTLGIFLQQENYLDKEQILVKDLAAEHLPLNKKWSWDRILRSCFIKQADVLQGLYFFEDEYDIETIRRNFDFYEPRTVHESSLSPCVHSILAAKLGYYDKAYEMYLRTSRLDLDDYNKDTDEGCHITSMAGTWMSIVRGFGGMRIHNGKPHFAPFIPTQWNTYAFNVLFRGTPLNVRVSHEGIHLLNEGTQPMEVVVHNRSYMLTVGTSVHIRAGAVPA
jgi:maltose phosphorylase